MTPVMKKKILEGLTKTVLEALEDRKKKEKEARKQRERPLLPSFGSSFRDLKLPKTKQSVDESDSELNAPDSGSRKKKSARKRDEAIGQNLRLLPTSISNQYSREARNDSDEKL
jgi:hypothetical protein